MKKLIKLLAILAVAASFATQVAAQGITIATYVEYTKVSPKLGYMLGYTFDQDIAIELGAFYQAEFVESNTAVVEGYMKEREKVFTGIYFGYPAISTREFDLMIQIRTGIVNNENFVITPTIEGRYKFGQRVFVGAAVGTRCFSPTVLGKIGWTF